MDDGTTVSHKVQQHLQGCGACEHHYQLQQRLISQLSQQAPQDCFEPSPFLRGKIVAAVRQAAEGGPQTASAPRISWMGGLAFSSVAALAIAFGVMMNQPEPTPPSAELLTRVIQLSGDQVLEEATGQDFEAWSLSLNQPLETELQLVMNDARSAIDSLAASFIPESFLAANTSLTQ